MKSLASNQKNDLVIGADGRLSIVTGAAAVEVVARSHMQTRRGEMIHAMQQGIPFDLVVFGASPNIAQFEAYARRRLMSITGVIEVVQFEATLVGDELTYTATLLTEYGETTVNG